MVLLFAKSTRSLCNMKAVSSGAEIGTW